MRKLDLSDTKSIRAFAEGFLAGKALVGRQKSKKLGEGGAAPPRPVSDLTSELSWIPLDGFCHMNQQGRELARGWRVDQLGRILIIFLPLQWECWRYQLPVWACTLASRCGPDATLFFHSEKQPSVATGTR